MRIRITRSLAASPNGIQIVEYQAGQTVQMPDDLGGVFIQQGWGTAEAEPAAPGPTETSTKRPARKGNPEG